MSITYSTSNERSMIFGKGVDAHSLFDADKCGQSRGNVYCTKAWYEWSMTIKNEMNDTDYPNTKQRGNLFWSPAV